MPLPKGMSRELASVAAATGAMILCEIVLGNHANYVYSDAFQLYLPMIVFGSVAAGSLIGLVKPFSTMPLARLLVLVAAAVLAGFLGIARAPALGAVWVGLPIVAFGVYLCRVLCDVPLKTVVWALGLGGGLLYLLYDGMIGAFGDGLVVVIVALTTAAAMILDPDRLVVAAGGVILIAAGACRAAGTFETPSFVQTHAPGLAGSENIRAPIFTPLIRTDLVKTRQGGRVMTTNGSRFAVVPFREHVKKVLAGGGNAFYEPPYFASLPETVLVIGSAEGENVLTALGHGAKDVVAVDINPAVFQIMKNDMAEFSGGLYNEPRVTSVASEGRRFTELTDRTFDLITLQGVQTGSTSNLASTALLESFLFTEEAMAAAWRALSPKGVLFYEEYRRYRDEQQRDVTLIGILAGASPQALGIADPARQIVYYSYLQGRGNPNGEGRVREGLLLYKAPLDDAALEKVKKGLEDLGADVEKVPTGVSGTIVDDRPFFIQMVFAQVLARVPLWIPPIVFAALVALAFTRLRRSPGGPASLSLFLTGIGFMLLVLAITGPATLLLGDPQLATPVVFVAVYAWGLAGGLLALRAGRKGMLGGLVGLCGYLIVLALVLPRVKPLVLSIASLPARVAVVSLLLLPAALLAELPYIYMLSRFEGRARGKAYAWENIGTVVGIPLGFALQVTRGFTADLLGAAVVYLAALLVLLPRSAGADAAG
jgi:SAM-dependent methyltransferase